MNLLTFRSHFCQILPAASKNKPQIQILVWITEQAGRAQAQGAQRGQGAPGLGPSYKATAATTAGRRKASTKT